MQVAVARQVYVANDRADAEAALARQAEFAERTLKVSRSPGRVGGSHVLAYAGQGGGTERNALYGTADEICAELATLERAGAEYVLLTIPGAKQLRRFAAEVMPEFPTQTPVGVS